MHRIDEVTVHEQAAAPPTDIVEPAPFEVFWAAYLLHHTQPVTRRLHFLGTLVVLVGCAAAVASRSVLLAVAALWVGYALAFAGHWVVERNQPLTLKSPIRAGFCNLRLFALECLAIVRVGGGYRGAVARALAVVPLAVAQACTDVPNDQQEDVRAPEFFVMRSFVAVATSPAMPRWPEYSDRVARERGVGPLPSMPTACALRRALGARALIAQPTHGVVGSLVSFLDDHAAPFPRACFPAADAEALFDALTREPPHTTTPERLLTLALRRTSDGFRALLACHLATRHLARGRDARAFQGLHLSLDERCDVGIAIAPFPATLACGGDPLGDTYHYFANVIAGVLAVQDRLAGWAIARLFRAGPDLMHWVRERTFGRPLFFGNHADVDRCGLAHGMALTRSASVGHNVAHGLGQSRSREVWRATGAAERPPASG